MRGCRGVWYARIKQVSVSWLLLELTVTEFAEITRKKKEKKSICPKENRRLKWELKCIHALYAALMGTTQRNQFQRRAEEWSVLCIGKRFEIPRRSIPHTEMLVPLIQKVYVFHSPDVKYLIAFWRLHCRGCSPFCSFLLLRTFYLHTHTHTQNK